MLCFLNWYIGMQPLCTTFVLDFQAHPNHIAMVEQRMFLQLGTKDRPYIAIAGLPLFERPAGSEDCRRAHLFDWKSGSITKKMIKDVQKKFLTTNWALV